MYRPVKALILGAPGSGKTRLAGTFPATYFLDLERGAATAHPGQVRRLEIPVTTHTLKDVHAALDKLAACKFENDALVTNVGPVKTLVVDSIDAVQQAVMDFQILQGRRFQMEQRDWGVLLTMIRPLILKLNSLPISAVAIAHTKQREPREKGSNIGIMDLSVQGSLRDQMPRWFDVVMHISLGPDAKRTLVREGGVHQYYYWLAKDRHGYLRELSKGKNTMPLPANAEGYPTLEVATALTGESFKEEVIGEEHTEDA